MGGMRQRRRGVVVNLGSGVSTMLPSAPLLSGGNDTAGPGRRRWRRCLAGTLEPPPRNLPLHAALTRRCRSESDPLASRLLAVYAGTKAYVDTFSRSLDAEYAAFGVRVQNQSPLFVATKMSKIR